MADGGFPNLDRANRALTIYSAAMCPYVASVIEENYGTTQLRSQLLSDRFRENDPNGYDRREAALDRGAPVRNLVDFPDIPHLVEANSEVFPDLRSSNTQLRRIRTLRNREITHRPDKGRDCKPEVADEISRLCGLVLERCGLTEAAENVRRPSPRALAGAPAVAEEDLRQQRARREWYKARFADKSPQELKPWEEELLVELEWEEEWERRELVRSEREEIEQLGGDIDGLRRWFDAVAERQERHTSKYATLIRREQLERERAEIAAFGDDIDGLRRWFDSNKGRPKRHASEYSTLARRERARQEQREREQRRTERRRRERELQERERAEIAALGDDINGLRQWFDTYKVRPKRHPDEYAALLQREQEREQERREHERQERERAEIAAFGDDINGLRQWFDTYKVRPKRHPAEYAALLQREQKQRERELQERERAEIAAFGDDIDGLRRWFDDDRSRQHRYPSQHELLRRRELERREQGRAEIAAFGDDIDGLRHWFDVDPERQEYLQPEYAALLQREQEARQEAAARERERAEQERREKIKREQAEIAAFGDDLDGLRRWFRADYRRQKRHAVEHATLLRREREKREQQERLQRPSQGARRSILSRVFRR